MVKPSCPLSTARRLAPWVRLGNPGSAPLRVSPSPTLAASLAAFGGDFRLLAVAGSGAFPVKGDVVALNYINRGTLRRLRETYEIPMAELASLFSIPSDKLFRWLKAEKDNADRVPIVFWDFLRIQNTYFEKRFGPGEPGMVARAEYLRARALRLYAEREGLNVTP